MSKDCHVWSFKYLCDVQCFKLDLFVYIPMNGDVVVVGRVVGVVVGVVDGLVVGVVVGEVVGVVDIMRTPK